MKKRPQSVRRDRFFKAINIEGRARALQNALVSRLCLYYVTRNVFCQILQAPERVLFMVMQIYNA